MHIFLYVLDTLRPDHLGCYGYERDVSPNIDLLAKDGVLFEKCFTSTTWTRPVAASILTGAYPETHQTRLRKDSFTTPLTRLPELLQQGGYKTIGITTMGNLASNLGFDKGFNQYLDLFRDPEITSKRAKRDHVRKELLDLLDSKESNIALPLAEDINEKLVPLIEKYQTENTFFFIWSIEPHVPYSPPDQFRRYSPPSSDLKEGTPEDIFSSGADDRKRLIDLYDDEIFYNDHCLGEIIEYLNESGIYDESMFIVIGDHGEAFFEHGGYTHGHAPYEELIHVPMVMKFPKSKYAGQRVNQLVSLLDIFPTVTMASNLIINPTDHRFVQGMNLLPLLDGDRESLRDYVYSDTQTLDFHNRYLSIRGNRWKYLKLQKPQRKPSSITKLVKYIISRRLLIQIVKSPLHFFRNYFQKSNRFLFDLQSDPGELNNLINVRPEIAEEMDRRLNEWIKANQTLAVDVEKPIGEVEESDVLKEHLEKLGYL